MLGYLTRSARAICA